jgi:regulator of protease activity HflC (stomatin/prohibitin superfamily)
MKKIILAAAVIFLGACSQIDTGNVGVERTLGKVSETPLPQGLYFTLFKTVDEFTAKEVSFALNDLTPKSKDNLTMRDVDIDVYYKAAPAAIPKLVTKYQGDIAKDKSGDSIAAWGRVTREGREAAYRAVSELDATTMHTQRTELAESIRQKLQAGLEETDPGAFLVTSVNVRSLVTDPAIEKAIRERAEMDQQVERKKKELELARAEAERREVEARGEARANDIISSSLTQSLKEIKLAEIARDTAFAVSKGAGNTVLLQGGAMPLINVGK